MSDNLVLHFDTHPIKLISVFVCSCMYMQAVFVESGFFLKVAESEDVADGLREHCLLQNWLPVFAFDPGCLCFPKLFGEAERGRGPPQCTHSSEGLARSMEVWAQLLGQS